MDALEDIEAELGRHVKSVCDRLDAGIIGKANRVLREKGVEPVTVNLKFGGATVIYTPIYQGTD